MWLSSEANQERARAAEEQFENSDFVKELKRRSEENREKCATLPPLLLSTFPRRNKRAIEAKYCLRQAEIGIGDCADLQVIGPSTKCH